jgi:hypothetical protein
MRSATMISSAPAKSIPPASQAIVNTPIEPELSFF